MSLHTGWDVLRDAELGHTVLLVDDLGHYEATDVAQRLIDTGHRVLMVSRYAQVAANLEMRWEMVGAPLLAQLMRGDFTFFARSVVHRLAPGRADVAPCEAPQRVQSLEFDDVVMMSGGVPDRSLADALRAALPVVRVIGDANLPRRLEIALVEALSSVDWLDEGWIPSPASYGLGGSAT